MGIFTGIKWAADQLRDQANTRLVQPYIIERAKEAYEPVREGMLRTRMELGSALRKQGNAFDEFIGMGIGALREQFDFLKNHEFLGQLEEICNRRLLHMGQYSASEKQLHDATSASFEELARLKARKESREDDPSTFPLLERQLTSIMNGYREKCSLPEFQLLKNSHFENQKRSAAIRDQGVEAVEGLPSPARCAVPPDLHPDMNADERERASQLAISQRNQIMTREIPLQLELFEDDDVNWNSGDPHYLYTLLDQNKDFQKAMDDPHMVAVDISVSRSGSRCGVSLIFSSVAPHPEELSYEESLAELETTPDYDKQQWENMLGKKAEEGSDLWCMYNGYEVGKAFDPSKPGPRHIPFQSWYSLYCLNQFSQSVSRLASSQQRDIHIVNTTMPPLSPDKVSDIRNPKTSTRPELKITISYQGLTDKGDQGASLSSITDELYLKEGTDIVRLKSDSPLLKSSDGDDQPSGSGQFLRLSEVSRRLRKRVHTREWKYSGKHETDAEKAERLKKDKEMKEKKEKAAKAKEKSEESL